MITIKKLVQYIDSISPKDINGVKNSVDLLFSFYKKQDVINEEYASFLNLIYDRIKKEFPEEDFAVLMVGFYLGLIIGKFSRKIKLKDYEL